MIQITSLLTNHKQPWVGFFSLSGTGRLKRPCTLINLDPANDDLPCPKEQTDGEQREASWCQVIYLYLVLLKMFFCFWPYLRAFCFFLFVLRFLEQIQVYTYLNINLFNLFWERQIPSWLIVGKALNQQVAECAGQMWLIFTFVGGVLWHWRTAVFAVLVWTVLRTCVWFRGMTCFA